jgi:hypothetical protein
MKGFELEGAWSLELEDGTHQVRADVKQGLASMHITITWDGRVIHDSSLWLLIGELRHFEQSGHSFVLSHRGYGMFGQFVLFMDGRDLGGSPESFIPGPGHLASAALNYVKGTHAPAEAAVAAPQPSAAPSIQFVKELSCTETDEIVGKEEYPLDNRFGSSPFSTDRQVSKESTNELSVDVTKEVNGKLDLEIISAVKAEVAAQFSRTTGCKIGEKVTESQTLHFSVGPNQSVLYQVVWKRKVRSGEHLYMAGGAPVTVPYRIDYGLSCEVRTLELPKSASD